MSEFVPGKSAGKFMEQVWLPPSVVIVITYLPDCHVPVGVVMVPDNWSEQSIRVHICLQPERPKVKALTVRAKITFNMFFISPECAGRHLGQLYGDFGLAAHGRAARAIWPMLFVIGAEVFIGEENSVALNLDCHVAGRTYDPPTDSVLARERGTISAR